MNRDGVIFVLRLRNVRGIPLTCTVQEALFASRDHGGSLWPFIHLGSLLGHFHQGVELVLNSWQSNLLKQALLSLSEHHTDQHIEHGWTHVVAGSVGERLLQVVQGS